MITSEFNGFKVNLVENLDDIETMLSTFSPKIPVGVDTETTGLDFIKDSVVGVCVSGGKSFSKQDYAGYYLPIRHQTSNLPIDKVISVVKKLISENITMFFNRNFDAFMLEKEGVEIPFVGKMHDVQCMAHLALSESYPSLKDFSRRFLKWDMIDFEENGAKDHNFGLTDPKISFIYAAGDPLATVFLGKELCSRFPYIKKIYPLDNKATEAVRRLSKQEILLDYEKVRIEQQVVAEELKAVSEEIYSLAGFRFNLNSTREKAQAISMFCSLSAKTKSGNAKVSKDVLQELDIPITRLLLKYSELQKYLGTYLTKMLTFQGHAFRVNYSACNTITGRLSSGGAKGNSYYMNFNAQNIPKREVKKYLHSHSILGQVVRGNKGIFVDTSAVLLTADGEFPIVSIPQNVQESLSLSVSDKVIDNAVILNDSIILNDENTIKLADGTLIQAESLKEGDSILVNGQSVLITKITLEHRFFVDVECQESLKFKNGIIVFNSIVRDDSGNYIKLKCKGGLRDAFIAPRGWVVIASDYSAQEMVCMANFSKEPNLINPIKEGYDIHRYISKKMFNFEDDEHRTVVKVLNFACNYGAKGFTIGKKLGISEDEGNKLLDRYNKTLSKLFAWKQEMIRKARRTGMIFTFFGRPRIVSKYYASSSRSDWAFADRTAMNSPVQGCLPLDSYIADAKGVHYVPNVLANRLQATTGEFFVPTKQNKNTLVFLEFYSGEFVVCDVNHKFIGSLNGKDDCIPVYDERIYDSVIYGSYGRRKMFTLGKSLKFIDILSKILRNESFSFDDQSVINGLWKLAITRKSFHLKINIAVKLRTIAASFGFNLIKVGKGMYRISLIRNYKLKVKRITPLESTKDTGADTFSCTVLDNPAIYTCQGVLNKNTGGDVIRIVLCRIFERMESDEEFRTNCSIFTTVHDEVDFYCKVEYLHKLYTILKEIMTIHPKEFELPLTTSFGVGWTWGTCADCKSISEDNKITFV